MAQTPQSTVVLGSLIYGILFSFLQIYAETLAASPPLTILAGLICAILTVLGFLVLGNVAVIVLGSSHEASWAEAAISLFAAIVIAGTVHGVSVTTCFAFSIALLYAVARASHWINVSSKRRR
ncbi:keratinocytes-associated protein 2 [Thecamonas trahens ATCC 50062]|uniref:Keratinocytes-associated protein 2 n=1 Tax=Thecamonas trahens ATCC 50062 TaxID=461836 RepID=A0A0L0DFX4_THETB|nr:keratinocytes-associated protein 2 [Thecamonas trahens ATCC 50062]KNC51204.1 keratinocytes-associated protein 2 [Thecamonas trahens ATCC 50062]|eukprot:XP_013756402.1 keratinocytes-associated protein 2 [Thecamonas trahens ATCC 50062]